MATDNKANPYYAGDMLDIIFENRNKSYGAYDLRRNYPNFIRKALIGGLLIAALLVAIPFITRAISDATEKKDVEVKVELGPPPSINPNEPPLSHRSPSAALIVFPPFLLFFSTPSSYIQHDTEFFNTKRIRIAQNLLLN